MITGVWIDVSHVFMPLMTGQHIFGNSSWQLKNTLMLLLLQ